VRVDELAVRRWRWSTWVPASLGPPLALAVGGVGVGQRGRRGGTGVLPASLALTLDRVGFLWEGFVAANLVVRAPAPLPFYIALATRAHQPDGLDAPDKGASRESDSAFGSSREINPNMKPSSRYT